MAVSLLVVVPCFWHRHIEAGDLGSHVYNAWLATLIQKGQASCLYLTSSWTNFLFDDLLIFFGKAFGFLWGEKATLAVLVLIFFWGSFALIDAIAGRRPWVVAPAIAALAYGFTFNSGFCNCYLSVGLAFIALSLIWRSDRLARWLLAACFVALSAAAHPFGIVVFAGIAAYEKSAQSLSRFRPARWALFGLGFAVVYAAHVVLSRFSPIYGPTRKFFLFNGGDQLYLFGARYGYLGQVVTLFGFIVFVAGYFSGRNRRNETEQRFRVPLELWLILMSAAVLLPQVVTLPQYATIFGPIVSRLTLVSAVLVLAVVATVPAKAWHFGGYAALTAVFFVFLFQDTATLSEVADEADAIIHQLPYGTRVVETIGGKQGWRTNFLHIIEPECIEHCLVYDNYEPASLQFRIRVRPGCRLATSSMHEAVLLQYGTFIVKPSELPLKQIYQCSIDSITRLCIKDLAANQPNCAGCNYAFYWGGAPPQS